MNHNFKPGDLAMIVGAFSVQQNIGKTVVLEEFLADEQISTWRDPSDGQRIQNTSGSAGWIVLGEDVKSYCGSNGWVLADPSHLMPLRGDFALELQKSQEVPA